MPLTRSDVIEAIGNLDDAVIADVIATGADQRELALAVERLRDDTHIDDDMLDAHVVALCDLLAPIITRDDDDEEIPATD